MYVKYLPSTAIKEFMVKYTNHFSFKAKIISSYWLNDSVMECFYRTSNSIFYVLCAFIDQ